MKIERARLTKRALACVLITSVVGSAFADVVSISNVPLVSSSGGNVLPNLLYTLDDSGSMGFDYLPDYVNDSNTCMIESDGSTTCQRGDPPFEAGGVQGFNGVGYDPNTFYAPGVNSDGTFKLNPPLSLTSLTPNAYLGGTAVNLTSGIADRAFCNSAGVCKRNGQDGSGNLLSGTDASANAMGAGQFPYRTHASNSSTLIFGLPEMMSTGSFSRSSNTVTVTTVEPHNLTTSDKVFVSASNTNLNVTCVGVASVTANTFTYSTGGSSGTINAASGGYRKCVNLTSGFTQSGTTVTVISTAHGLATGDVITTTTGTSSVNGTNRTVTVVDANTFRYTSSSSGTVNAPGIAGSWVRNGLYNRASNSSGAPPVYRITPVEYCSDSALTTCTLAATPGTAPAGFPFPAYVRFCKSVDESFAPGVVTGSSGSPATSRCQAKYVNSGGLVYKFPRFGRFTRENVVPAVDSYGNRPDRSDCAAVPTCTYNEEIQNYARWYTFYRTRMQMMKTATGRAFVTFVGNPSATPSKPNTIRVGFITIHAQDSGSIASSKYLRIGDFDTTQASTFFSKLYAIVPNSGTPLQEALSRAGWIFAGKLGSGLTNGLVAADDPVQASCQRNYSILTTDGYWNGNLGQDLGGDNVGNMDGVDPTTIAPYSQAMVDRASTVTYDGSNPGTLTVKSSTPTDTLVQAICQGSNSVLGGVNNCGCASGQHRVKQRTDLSNHVVTTVNGVVQSDTTSNGGSTFDDITACVAGDTVSTTSTDTIVEDQLGKRNNNSNRVQFSDNTRESISCTSSKPNIVVRQTKTVVHTVVTTDGVTTSDTSSTTSVTYSWSNDNATFTTFTDGTTIPTGGGSCGSSSLRVTLSPNPQTTAGAPVQTATTGTPVAVTLSPNPQTQAAGATTTTATGGISDTLADVAMYYYQTDLRGGTDVHGNATGPSRNLGGTGTVDVSLNNIDTKSGAKDFAKHQHMVTFTLGLADGFMSYVPDYDKAATGDFVNISNGSTGLCFWNGSGACNWPAPAADAPTALDDLWHAAVNGRGVFYQALNANALATGLSASLNALNTDVAAAAAAATSSPNVTQQDNQIFSTTYETNTWSGQIISRTIDPQSGAINPDIQWHADAALLTKVQPASDTRNIWTYDPSAASKLKAFTWANMTSTQEQSWFQGICTASLGSMQQCSPLQAQPSQFAIANDGASMLGFLRGQTGNEGTVFRDRVVIDTLNNTTSQTVLGDTVSAKPAFVRLPTFNYTDSGYSAFKTANGNRSPRVFVGANDGYLHAFNATNGDEAWAYAPRFLLPGMFALADTGYASRHRFFVDGSPETADVFDSTAGVWKTILVGGVAGGGRGFYALDVTDPVSPVGLWEFCSDSTVCSPADTDLGLSYGSPIIGKRASDGKWVVILTSGLNNINPGTGIGYFFVLDAITGAVLNKVPTTAGTGTTPSGLMKASAFFDAALTSASFQYVYAGDQLGNVWRLDVSTTPPTVMHLATLTDGSTPPRAQPITTKASLTHIGTSRVLYIGTGRYLGKPDLSDPGAASGIAYQQSLYGFKDKDSDYGNLRATGNLVKQTFTLVTPTERGITNNPMDWSVRDGWMVDFSPPLPVDPSPGELVNIDPKLVLGTLVVITNIPTTSADSCTSGGTSKFYNFDFKTGSAVTSSPNGVVGWSSGTIIVGGSIVQTSDGSIKDELTDKTGGITPSGVQQNNAAAGVKRFSYRVR
jgi:Tfp pilus tip-associated adhesin PilY1